MIIFRTLHSEVQKCIFFKNNILSFIWSTSSVKWQKMFVNSKTTQAFQAFLSQLRSFLCPGLLLFYIPRGWLRSLVEEMASHTSDLHTRASTLMPTTTSGSGLPPISPPDGHLVVARWPKLHLLMVLPHAGPEVSTGC